MEGGTSAILKEHSCFALLERHVENDQFYKSKLMIKFAVKGYFILGDEKFFFFFVLISRPFQKQEHYHDLTAGHALSLSTNVRPISVSLYAS